MLLRPNPIPYESLESYLVRLAELYEYTPQQLIERFHIILDEEDQELAGALPGQLWLFNLYHANTSSSLRFRCLELLAEKMCKGYLPILELSVYRSQTQYAFRHNSLFWRGRDIPQFFFRKNCIPICPKCFEEAEKPYIPFYWHLHLVRVCTVHACQLIEQCPDCLSPLNYMRTGNLEGCTCGKKYKTMDVNASSEPLLHLAMKVQEEDVSLISSTNLLCELGDVHQLFGAILWFYSYVAERGSHRSITDETLAECIQFFDHWPDNLNSLLRAKIENAIMLADRKFSETSFQSVFGSLLIKGRRLPSDALPENPVLKAIVTFFDECIHAENELAEIGYTLLNGFEVSAFLNTSAEQVARLSDSGKLKAVKKLKNKSSFDPKRPLFQLKDVFCLWLVRFQSRVSNRNLYLSRW